MTLFYALDLLGILAFSISGTLTAMHKKLDPFGVLIIAFITALGGGTLRDMLIGRTPVSWMHNMDYIYCVALGIVIAILFKKRIQYLRKSLFLFDTLGLSVCTIIGLEIGMDSGLNMIISIALGTMTGTFGGVIRDTLCNEIPVVFRKEVYALASIAGGLLFIGLLELNVAKDVIYVATISLILIIRLVSVKYKLQLPMYH